MRNSDWNNRDSQTRRHHHHHHNQTTSLSPSSNDHATSLLSNKHQYSKPSWTYDVEPCGMRYSRSGEDAGVTNLHMKGKTSLAATKIPISIRRNDLDYTTGSSSITSSTTISENLHQKLIGVPFITTTSDLTSDGSSVADLKQSTNPSTNDSINSVRRTASFTFSPKGCLDKVNQRLQVHDIEPKRRL
ncbi:hypothetical protein WUBG_00810 [Wuchereria bancrofti]|uniref:Uncharacterized protein n=1 Tax=Wuchereria bancrofti TaxID=6293 RepID=J9BLA4_WUCBA|nr:hypothetical protein WUBG_00810 [Wuchereria bancrofti]